MNASRPGPALTKLLVDGQSGFRWTAAAVGAMSASGYQLAARQPVMAIGGFNGSDPTPTLAAFQVLVRNHQVHYFLGGGLGGFPGGGPGAGSGAANTSSAISTWVGSTFSAKTVDGITLYDLTAPTTTAP